MSKFTAIYLLLSLVAPIIASAQEQYSFGNSIQIELAQDVSKVIAEPSLHLGKSVIVKGVIEAVCAKKQCWMTISTQDYEPKFRIKVDDGEIHFPFSAKGKTAYIEGIFENWVQSDLNIPGYQLKATTVLIEH